MKIIIEQEVTNDKRISSSIFLGIASLVFLGFFIWNIINKSWLISIGFFILASLLAYTGIKIFKQKIEILQIDNVTKYKVEETQSQKQIPENEEDKISKEETEEKDEQSITK